MVSAIIAMVRNTSLGRLGDLRPGEDIILLAKVASEEVNVALDGELAQISILA